MTDETCAYCNQPLGNEQTAYKWFPSEKKMKKVHNKHLRFNRKGAEHETQTGVDTGSDAEGSPEPDSE